MSAVAAQGDLVYGRDDFERVRRLIYRQAGIALADHKEAMAYSRLSRRLRALGMTRFQAYLDRLETEPGWDEWEHFVNALTTNLTAFFREAHHFPILTRHLLGLNKPELRVWSCASSTGEEPYSIAFTAAQAWGSLTPPVRILATDLDTQVLAAGRAAVYTQDRVESLTPDVLRQFFLRGTGPNAGKVRVRPELAALVHFQPLNLLATDWPRLQPFDAIFCRNVMIYFDKPTQARLLHRLWEHLEPGGLLFCGHSESMASTLDLFEPIGQTVYRRAGRRAAAAGMRR
ncbi:CheR family methyltransferase [Pseudacidovorax intermedius]|uniref:Chemotaxis protein methyltransferase n=1 Tax=Pseudacidovorax intermedius TaxID=433924 RepID=A0A147GMG7_9BURK|nr:CheR family methyltransferase [Pseudacidovorax intermedius]KTT14646.1 chemotaxis protein CheR [Pseudacidovorax intermedius]